MQERFTKADLLRMGEAIKQAKLAFSCDEVPVGVIITKNSKIIAKAHNQVETLKDPTAHAEMIAITQATNALSSKWLHECTMYVTVEPCSMCAGALVLARLGRLCIGAMDAKAGACGSVVNIAQHNQLNHQVPIETGLLAEECGQLIKEFFQKKRIDKRMESV